VAHNQSLGLAWRGAQDLLEVKFGWQDIPHEYYPNQRMDMLANTEHRTSLHYLGQRTWGTLEARVYRETVDHYMNFSPDMQFFYGTPATIPGMPMNTDSLNTGGSLKANFDLGGGDVFRLGGEYQHFRLDDWWSPSGGGMAPNTFQNIDNGKRDRAVLYGEWEQRLGGQWTALFGLRYEQVSMNADPVHGYNVNSFPVVATPAGMMNQTRDAANFNNQDRNKTDHNLDIAGSAHRTVDANSDYELGFARKVRSPNLYERYSWSRASMMAIMNNFAGDGNGYIGNPAIKPEVAYTLSLTGNWHSADHGSELKVTPYYTYVKDYIDAVQWNGTTDQQATTLVTNQFAVLRYVNQDARIWGMDVSGHLALAKTAWGNFGLKGVVGCTKGTNQDTGYGLYNIMPFNGKVALTQDLGGWSGALETQWVGAKTRVSAERNEIKTSEYTLLNLRCAYAWKLVRLDLAVENLFDKFYASPLGGAYTGQGMTMGINSIPWGIPVPGMGRSINAALTVKF
jgi:iron complex outermembrane receptor protein